MFNLYKNIAELCSDRGISVSAMCDKVGISKSIMSNLKNKRSDSITLKTAEKIAAFLDVSTDRILHGDGSDEGIDEKASSAASEEAALDADTILIIELLGKLTPSNRDRALAFLQGLAAGQS